MRGVLHNIYLLKNRRHVNAKRQFRSVIWVQFGAKAQLRTLFRTRFRFIKKPAGLKQTDSCVLWFGANFKQQHSCARCFAQVLSPTAIRSSLDILDHTNQLRYIYSCEVFCKIFTFYKDRRHVDAKRQFRSLIWGQFAAKAQLRTLFRTRFSFLTIRSNLKQNDSSAVWFGANFQQQHSCARCFAQVLYPTASRSSLDILDHTNKFRYIYSCAVFCTIFTF